MADRTVATTNTLNYFRHEFNGTAEDIGAIADILSASSYIASATDVVEAIVLLNPELPEITTDAFVFPVGTMVWEGATDNAHETTLAFTDPTADRTYTFPNASGDVVLADSTDTSSSKTLTSPTINAGALTGAFTGTADLTGLVLSGASPLVFEGSTADEYETTLTITDPTADRTVTMPNATDTLIGKATTDTLTNKSFDLGGSGNSLTGSLAEWNAALQSESFVSLTGSETLTNKTLTTPTITSAVLNTAVSGSAVLDEDAMGSNSATKLATQQSIKAYVGNQIDSEMDLVFAGDSGGSLNIVMDSESMTFTGGTGIDTSGSGNVMTTAIDSTVSTLTGTQTYTNKTLTTPTLTSPVLNTGLSGSAFLDEDNMGSNSATKMASQQSIKAYVDAQTTAQDLDFQGDSGGALDIDLDSESMTFAGGTGIASSASSTTVTFAIDSTVATLTGSQTLTNKTLTTPTATSAVLNTAVSGSAIKDEDNMSSNSATHLATQQSIKAYADSQTTAQDLDFQGDSGGALDIDLDSETLTLAGGTLVSTAASGTTVTFTADTTNMGILTGTQTWTNKTFTSPTVSTMAMDAGTSSGTNVGATGIVFEGATTNAYETTLTATDPTADNVITIPNSTMTLLTTATHATIGTHISKCMALG